MDEDVSFRACGWDIRSSALVSLFEFSIRRIFYF